MYTIENEKLRASFQLHGGELISLYDKSKQQELIWQADPAFWGRHAPVLFPFVGKVNGGEYRVNGQTYTMGQHGFARDMDFQLKDQTETTITFELRSSEETMAKYPFAFQLEIRYVLAGDVLEVHWKVTNPAAETMYYSIGAHPAFSVDAAQKEAYRVRLGNADQTLSYIYIDPETAGADWEHVQELALDGDGSVQAKKELFEKDALIFDDGQITEASIVTPEGETMVTVRCPGFPSFGLWSPSKDAGFICLEPWVGRVDNNGFDGELKDKYGEQSLAAGASQSYVYEIVVG